MLGSQRALIQLIVVFRRLVRGSLRIKNPPTDETGRGHEGSRYLEGKIVTAGWGVRFFCARLLCLNGLDILDYSLAEITAGHGAAKVPGACFGVLDGADNDLIEFVCRILQIAASCLCPFPIQQLRGRE